MTLPEVRRVYRRAAMTWFYRYFDVKRHGGFAARRGDTGTLLKKIPRRTSKIKELAIKGRDGKLTLRSDRWPFHHQLVVTGS